MNGSVKSENLLRGPGPLHQFGTINTKSRVNVASGMQSSPLFPHKAVSLLCESI